MGKGEWRGSWVEDPRIKYDVCRPRARAEYVIQDALSIAWTLGMMIEFEIHGVVVRVTEGSEPIKLVAAIEGQRDTKQPALVGPLEETKARDEQLRTRRLLVVKHLGNPRFAYDVFHGGGATGRQRRSGDIVRDAVEVATIIGMKVEIVVQGRIVQVTARTDQARLIAEIENDATSEPSPVIGPCEQQDQ